MLCIKPGSYSFNTAVTDEETAIRANLAAAVTTLTHARPPTGCVDVDGVAGELFGADPADAVPAGIGGLNIHTL